MASPFTTYQDWKAAITGPCGLTLDQSYCKTRIAALQDPSIKSTKAFIDTYGTAYRDQIVGFFKRASDES